VLHLKNIRIEDGELRCHGIETGVNACEFDIAIDVESHRLKHVTIPGYSFSTSFAYQKLVSLLKERGSDNMPKEAVAVWG